MPQRAQQRLAGAIAGLLATMPTTAVMTVSKCCLLRPGQNSLAPGQTTQNALRALDLNGELSREEEVAWLVVNHFGFDASTGALYGSLCKPRPVADAFARQNASTGQASRVAVTWGGCVLRDFTALGSMTHPNGTHRRSSHILFGGAGFGLATRSISNEERGGLEFEV